VYLLGVTLFASTLHLLFEFLAFQSDIAFWQQNTSLTGLSVRSLVTDLISQIIIFLFLLDSNTSLLVTIPAFISIIIQIWKVYSLSLCLSLAHTLDLLSLHHGCYQTQKATGMKVKAGMKIVFTRLEPKKKTGEPTEEEVKEQLASDELTKISLEADRYATNHLGAIIFPLILGFAIRTLVMDKHASWYSWVITTLTGCV
jgi:hypothetical protein